MSEQKNLSTEIKFNGNEKYNKLLCLFHTGTDVKRKLLDTFLKEKQIILLDWQTSRSNAFLLFEDVKNARRKSATIVLEDLVLNTIDKVLWDCLDFFWDCCLKDDSLEDILEHHKELLYRKHVNSNNQQDSNSLTEDQWDILFKRKHEKDIETDQEENEQCFSATKGITISHLDSKLNILILSTVCPLFKSVSAVSECQSQISKIAVLQREVKDNEFEKIWDKFEDHIHKISSHCQLSDFFKRKCTIIKQCKVNKILTQQNRKSILVEALNFPDFIPDTKLCDDVRKELKFIDFEENLNIARAHCGRKIPVEFTTGQCEEGSYLRNWIEFAENDLQTLSSLHSRQVIDPYQEEVDVAQQTDDTQERLCKHNHLKLVQLITETARDVLADVLKERIPSDGFGASFDGMKNKILPLLDIQERHVLYPENSNYKGDLSDLDISLIYIILRNLNTICPHKNGWGNKPNDGDRCLSANIDRIRIAKNVHVSHCSKRLLNDKDFQKTWKEIRQCIIELVEPLPSCISYGDRIDFLLTSEINPGTEIELFNMHERAKKEERRLEQKINYLQECINDIQYQLNVNNRQSDNELKAAEFLGKGTKRASQTAADMTKKLRVTDKGIKIVKFGNVALELRIEGEDIPSVEEIEPYSQTLTTHEVRIKYIKEGSIIIGIDVSQSAFQNVGHFLEIIDTLVSSVFKIHIQKGNGRKIQASVFLDFLDNNNEPVSFSKRSLQRVENKEKRDEAAICCDVMGGTESVLLRKHQQKQNDLTICQPILVQRSISDTEQGLRILSCFKKTDQSPGNTCLHYTDGTHINHETRDTGKENGLKKYFERISSGTPVTTVDSMSNELLRLSSFSNFPSDINISLIKLAKTGFYYTGRRNTKCFSCGVTYDKWKSGDDPVVIHKMLSPSCALVNETRFSSSANQEERTTVVSNNTDSTVDTRTVTSHGLNQSENTSSTYEPRLQISSSYNGTSNNVQERQGNQQSSLSNRNRSSSATGNSQETQTSKENKNATGTSSCQHNTEFESLGIHLEKPKYQNYACLTVKISSFQGWPSYRDQPMFADETVYFSCGLGLRNWKADDDPWVEHARWFPKCTFLKQNKGEKFINAVQKRLEEIDYQTDETNENNQETEQRDQLAHITFLLYGRILCCFDCARIMRTCLVFMKYFKEFVKQILWIHQSNRYKDMFS